MRRPELDVKYDVVYSIFDGLTRRVQYSAG